MNTIGDNLKRCRRECGYTPRKLAELCGLAVEYVKEIEAGSAIPTPETVKELADAVRVRPEKLYGIAPVNDGGGIRTQMETDGTTTTVYVINGGDFELVSVYTDTTDTVITFRKREAEENDG